MPNYIIPLSDAEAWAKSWQTNPPKPLAKAHLIPLDVLTELLVIPEVVNVRAYMGVDTTGMQKLMFVGVDRNENDMTDTIYSGTMPCPQTCDITSPLYNP
ncbi:hypothetical protein G6N05_00960 [Flavobacterium sp. F372]|uniref:Uncharacterized protein n=1 Tax=Flavobacterium bernardetii TaxID=2813823 RepID=A0ABR7IUJ2_9FLAO|nr:hypothetical protein [Flavobacterium bernardetii]MBC5833444.1 hypothetical protein [Flavobacterium bernardetii]NHF68676.1 hypothetical protein [Flavobacterium bernardetii]